MKIYFPTDERTEFDKHKGLEDKMTSLSYMCHFHCLLTREMSSGTRHEIFTNAEVGRISQMNFHSSYFNAYIFVKTINKTVLQNRQFEIYSYY